MLAEQHCEPLRPGTPPLSTRDAEAMAREVPQWRLDGDRLVREWRRKDFRAALELANAIGRVAEQEQHHPDLHLTDYKRLRAVLTTHSVGGLSRNDFVLASRIDRLPEAA